MAAIASRRWTLLEKLPNTTASQLSERIGYRQKQLRFPARSRVVAGCAIHKENRFPMFRKSRFPTFHTSCLQVNSIGTDSLVEEGKRLSVLDFLASGSEQPPQRLLDHGRQLDHGIYRDIRRPCFDFGNMGLRYPRKPMHVPLAQSDFDPRYAKILPEYLALGLAVDPWHVIFRHNHCLGIKL
jgi:hypothetical protein